MNIDLKDRIINSSINLFSKNGIKSVNTDRIAAEVGISKRTLYEIFNSKEELIFEVIQTSIHKLENDWVELFEQFEDKNDFEFESVFQKSLSIVILSSNIFSENLMEDLKRQFPQLCDKLIVFKNIRLKEYFNKVFEIGVSKGFIKSNVNSDLVYLILLYSVENIIKPEVISELTLNSTEALNELFKIVLYGFLNCKQNS